MNANNEKKMSFFEHLEELRQRLIKCIIAVCVGIVICWIFKDRIFLFLRYPLYQAWASVEGLPEPEPLSFSGLLEPFVAYLKISAIGGLFVSAPFILYQLWKFISPGLYPRERRYALPFVLFSSLLFVGGALTAYVTVLPMGFQYFLELSLPGDLKTLESRTVLQPSELSTSTQKNTKILMSSLKEGECGKLTALPDAEGKGTILSFVWNKEECGKPPNLKHLTRDQVSRPLAWTELIESSDEHRYFEAHDSPLRPGQYIYGIKAFANSGGFRLNPVLMLQDYLTIVLQLLLAFGIVFELPVLISFLALAGIVNYKQLLKFSRWAIVAAVIVGAVLTPPDALSQMLLAGPLILLYFVSVLIAYLIGPKPSKS